MNASPPDQKRCPPKTIVHLHTRRKRVRARVRALPTAVLITVDTEHIHPTAARSFLYLLHDSRTAKEHVAVSPVYTTARSKNERHKTETKKQKNRHNKPASVNLIITSPQSSNHHLLLPAMPRHRRFYYRKPSTSNQTSKRRHQCSSLQLVVALWAKRLVRRHNLHPKIKSNRQPIYMILSTAAMCRPAARARTRAGGAGLACTTRKRIKNVSPFTFTTRAPPPKKCFRM